MKKRIIIPFGLLTLFWTVFVFCFLYPAGKIYFKNHNKKYMMQKLNEINAIHEEINLIREKQNNLKSKIFPPEDVLIQAKNIRDILIDIKKKGEKTNIKTVNVSIDKIITDPDSGLKTATQPLKITIKSPYQEIARYLSLLKTSPLISDIKAIRIEAKEESNELTTQINLNVICTP